MINKICNWSIYSLIYSEQIKALEEDINKKKTIQKQLNDQNVVYSGLEQEYVSNISRNNKLCEGLVVFEPKDLVSLRTKYSILISTHLWRPLSLSSSKLVWIYDNAIKLSMHCDNIENKEKMYSLKANIFIQDERETETIITRSRSDASREIIYEIQESRVILI